MEKYHEGMKCVKCGYNDLALTFRPGIALNDVGKLEIKCRRCDYKWDVKPLDYEERRPHVL